MERPHMTALMRGGSRGKWTQRRTGYRWRIESGISSTEAKRFGYAIAIGIHVLFIVVVNNLLDWGWFPWLTQEFKDLLPIINVALGVNIAVFLLYMAYDEPWFKATTQIVVNVIAILVVVRTFQVYPFDFSASEIPIEIPAFDLSWDLLVRLVLGLAIFGTAIAAVTETVKLFRAIYRT